MRVLGCSASPSSPPATWAGSSSGLLRSVQTDEMLIASVLMLIFRQPCMFADRSNLVLDPVVVEPDFVSASASFVNLSLMLFSCINGGSMICTSGSRVCGSCKFATVSGASTRTGISCVTTVSRLPPKALSNGASKPSSLFGPGVGKALYEFEDVVVTIVRASIGMLSFFVRRICADVAFRADLRARLSEESGTSRLMTLLAADCTDMASNMASWEAGQLSWQGAVYTRLTIERTLHQVRMVVNGHVKNCIDSRPDLCSLLRYDGEAYLLLAELDPCERTERIKGRSELWNTLAEVVTLKCVHVTCEGGDVLYLGFEAHRARWWRGTDASRKCSERLQ